jgi:Arc/MetJ-type ribon-helix-helix transcriptional regulator
MGQSSNRRSTSGSRFETVQVRLPGDVLRWVDEFRVSMKIAPSRSEAIRYLVERGKAAEDDAAI